MFGIGAERIHEKGKSTCYFSVFCLVGPRYLGQEDMVCARFRKRPAWQELLPVPFSGRGLVAGQEGLIQLCTGTGN